MTYSFELQEKLNAFTVETLKKVADAFPAIEAAGKKFEGKVINKRFFDALEVIEENNELRVYKDTGYLNNKTRIKIYVRKNDIKLGNGYYNAFEYEFLIDLKMDGKRLAAAPTIEEMQQQLDVEIKTYTIDTEKLNTIAETAQQLVTQLNELMEGLSYQEREMLKPKISRVAIVETRVLFK